MRFTDEQLGVLVACNEKFDSDWSLERVENGVMFLTIYPYALHKSYEREVGPDGSIWRFDEDTSIRVEATIDPKTESYYDRIQRRKVEYNF